MPLGYANSNSKVSLCSSHGDVQLLTFSCILRIPHRHHLSVNRDPAASPFRELQQHYKTDRFWNVKHVISLS